MIDEVSNSLTYNPFCQTGNYYAVFKHLIISLLLEEEIVLLDSDLSDAEMMNLTGQEDFEAYTHSIDKENFSFPKSKEQLVKKLRHTGDKWKITLFSSGTTGVPKKVSHHFESMTRFVKLADRNKNDIWGFAYNPTHMAGVQVFFQALLNGNSMVRLFGLNHDKIHTGIRENKITHLSATPSFYKLLLPCEDTFSSVVRLTSGGEKFNQKTVGQLKRIFPNAKITNVYASTETGSLFASKNDLFTIKAEFKDLIRVKDKELLIHNSLMGRSEMPVGEWYPTGDLIELVSENPLSFRFLSRKSEMINVGGYTVNPHEVEETLLGWPEIKNARVYGKSNSLVGNLICCDVVRTTDSLSETEIRKRLQGKLQDFKIPRIIRFVEQLSTTRTGKLKRN